MTTEGHIIMVGSNIFT